MSEWGRGRPDSHLWLWGQQLLLTSFLCRVWSYASSNLSWVQSFSPLFLPSTLASDTSTGGAEISLSELFASSSDGKVNLSGEGLGWQLGTKDRLQFGPLPQAAGTGTGHCCTVPFWLIRPGVWPVTRWTKFRLCPMLVWLWTRSKIRPAMGDWRGSKWRMGWWYWRKRLGIQRGIVGSVPDAWGSDHLLGNGCNIWSLLSLIIRCS